MSRSITRLMIAAPKKSSGKTLLTLGLTHSLTRRGYTVQNFKKGPDYIDPMWHKQASGQISYNLDPYLMEDQLIIDTFQRRSFGKDFSIIEGNHGLHDGLDLKGGNSNAFISKLLSAPVLIIVDATGMNRAIAAVVLGQIKMDPDVQIGGIVINNVRSSRQETKQREAIEYYCGVPVVGAIPKLKMVEIKERHLGLLTTHEAEHADDILHFAADSIDQYCDIEKIGSIAGKAPYLPGLPMEDETATEKVVKLGVARDKAFCFYYPENLEALEKAGAELVFFEPTRTEHLPEVDGIYLGGGFPESFLLELEKNKGLRLELKNSIESGMPVFAECGGLIYLGKTAEFNGTCSEMVGALDIEIAFQKRPVGYGYMELIPNKESSGWYNPEHSIKGHEFHYSYLKNNPAALNYNFDVKRGHGVGGQKDGIVYKNVVASYSHIHSANNPDWAIRFVNTMRRFRSDSCLRM